MSGLTRVNRNTGFTPAPSPAPILYPPSGPTSGRVTPSTAGQRGRASPGPAANQYSESPFGGGMSSGGAFGNQRSAHELEQHNDDLLSGLLGKVDTLKNLTIGIGNEVREGNLELGGMNDTFGSTSNLLSGTFTRMNAMARRQGSSWCYFMLFLLFVVWLFVVLWWWRR